MSVTAVNSQQSNEVVITIDGHFNFNAHQQFTDAYSEKPGEGTTFVVDLGRTDYMDSSALGMLLQLREHAGGSNQSVRLVNCNSDILEILRIANFNRLFHIE